MLYCASQPLTVRAVSLYCILGPSLVTRIPHRHRHPASHGGSRIAKDIRREQPAIDLSSLIQVWRNVFLITRSSARGSHKPTGREVRSQIDKFHFVRLWSSPQLFGKEKKIFWSFCDLLEGLWNIVRVTIQRELLKHGLQHWKLAQDTSARPDDSLVKEVGVRQRISEI